MVPSPRFAPWVIAIPVRSFVCKPGAVIVTVYDPGWTAGKLNKPAAFVVVSRVTLVASFFRTTFAFGITAPERSATIALIEPLAFWPSMAEGRTSKERMSPAHHRIDARTHRRTSDVEMTNPVIGYSLSRLRFKVRQPRQRTYYVAPSYGRFVNSV